ncbi:MAG: potassium transporter TrkG [Candidatus Thermoplasmatota archaeon]|nr:potassium transporter TrkG [Candidatus Thermoplasmatota archaeon]
MSATIALFLAATGFLCLGFLLNALCERKELSLKQSYTLIVLVFILLGFIGSIPYMYINISNGNPVQVFTDSVFESTSGYTTTGFSVISNLSSLPKSIILYRALTQFIGGLGIVLVLLVFFYPDAKLQEFSKSMGFTKNHKIKKTFLMILLIYMIFFIAIVVLGFIFGYRDGINLVSFIFTAISTGGFTPIADITNVATQSPLGILLIISMILGASNFIVLAGLFKLRFKEFLKSEVPVFLFMAFISISIVTISFSYSLFDSAFHVISAMSATGFSYLNVQSFPGNIKLFFVFLMFIGGASFSTAGGIKIYRFLLLFKITKKAITDTITQRDTTVKLFDKEYTNAELIQVVVMVILTAIIILISSLIVSSYGNPPMDSIFEVTSAIGTCGLNTGIVGPTMSIELKWLFVLLMILGRVEILAFFIMFSRAKEPKEIWSTN